MCAQFESSQFSLSPKEDDDLGGEVEPDIEGEDDLDDDDLDDEEGEEDDDFDEEFEDELIDLDDEYDDVGKDDDDGRPPKKGYDG